MEEMHLQYEKRLRALTIEKGAIAEIEFLKAEPSPKADGGEPLYPLPERCEVTYRLYPTEQSEITCVIVLPLTGWNKKFLGTGNGGQAGVIVRQSLNAGVSRGFATANTDMGSSTDSKKMYRCPERWTDFAHRATHLMTVVGKRICEAFYGEAPQRAYFTGGSTGGQQALKEAQRYPEDYDGIVAYCPARNRYYLQQSFPWFIKVTCFDPEAVFTREQIGAVRSRIAERFAAASGGAEGDGFLSYPGKMTYAPEDADALFAGLGLNAAQLDVLKQLHRPPLDPQTKKPLFYAPPLGCEPSALTIPYLKEGYQALLGFFQRWGFGEDCDYLGITSEQFSEVFGPYQGEFDASEPDLSAFRAHGGKLLLVTGSEDSLIPYTDGKAYYESVLEKMGGEERVADFFRYFHVPGLGHCSGGNGLMELGNMVGLKSIPLTPERDALEAVMAWREEDRAPEVLYPSAFKDGDMKGEVDYVRPVYPYPYETQYTGGDRKDPKNFRKVRGNGVY